MEEFPEIKKLIEENRSILICANPSRNSLDIILAVSSLFYTLKKFGKVVKLYPENFFTNKPYFPFSLKELKNLILTFRNPNFFPEIYYKKTDDIMELCLLANGKLPKLEDINILIPEKNSQEINLIITVGVPSLESLGDFYEKNFKTFFNAPIINLDNNLDNREFGKVNLIEDYPLAFLVFKVICQFPVGIFDKYLAKSLFLGILLPLQKKKIQENVLEALCFLKKYIPDFKDIAETMLQDFSSKEKTLFEVFLRSMEYTPKAPFPIFALTKHQLKEWQLQEKDLPFGIRLFRERPLIVPSALFMWETHASSNFTKGVLYSTEEKYLLRLLQTFSGIKDKERIFFSTKKDLASTKNLILGMLHG